MSLHLISELAVGGSLILLEVALPLSILGAVVLSVRRWRKNGEYQDWWSLGGSPLGFIRPIIFWSLGISLLNLQLSESVTPKTLRSLRTEALDLGKYRWRTLLPNAISRLYPQLRLSESKQLGSWLIESPPTPSNLDRKAKRPEKGFTYIACSSQAKPQGEPESKYLKYKKERSLSGTLNAQCLSTWWRESDEREEAITLHELRLLSQSLDLNVGRLEVTVPAINLSRISQTFGPPNSLDSSDLNHSIHHRFIYFKRKVLPSYSLFFAIIAAWAGLCLSAWSCALVCLGVILLGFGGLRSLEILARAGWGPPELAAVLPVIFLLLICYWALKDLSTRHPPKI